MKAKRLSLILIVTVLSIAGCGTSENASSNLLPETEVNSSNDQVAFVENNPDSATDDKDIPATPIDASSEESSDGLNGISAEANTDSRLSYGYSEEDIKRLFTNYLKDISPHVDISALDMDISFSDGLYWVETFKDNETDSMHPTKSGNAYIDPVTGVGKFWFWGWYDDPDAVEVDFSKYDYPADSQGTEKKVNGEGKKALILHQLSKITFTEMSDALKGYLWVVLSQSTDHSYDNETVEIDFTDAEKIRAAVLASHPDGRIDDDSSDIELWKRSVSEAEVEENCINIFGTDARWDMLQTEPKDPSYDAVKFTDSTGTYPLIIMATTEDENQMEFQDYRIKEESDGYAGEIDMYWGYWGTFNNNPDLKTHTLVYHFVPDDRSKYGFVITSLEIGPFTGKSASVDSSNTSDAYSNDQHSTDDSSEQIVPFYGIWCSAAKDIVDANKAADKLKDSGFDAHVYLSSDWSNLNSDPWFVVTAGVFSSENEAKAVLEDVKNAGYPDAYVKYTGDCIRH